MYAITPVLLYLLPSARESFILTTNTWWRGIIKQDVNLWHCVNFYLFTKNVSSNYHHDSANASLA